MPFKSQAQRKYMYAQHPKIAKEFESKTPKGKLPEKVGKHQAIMATLKERAKG